MRLGRLAGGVCLLIAADVGPWGGVAQADDYCCVCRGQSTGKALDAGDDLSASLECSIICKRPTKPKAGACPAAAPPAAPAPVPAPAPAGRVLLFKAEDCSGEPAAVTQSTAQLGGALAGMRSFSVESGTPAAVFEKADYGGEQTAPVGPSLCVSPGWDIASVRIGTK